ncbi:MAG: nitrate reductase molybdenum cofactor assembly chaperone [Pseudomonadales bacterium]|nr:nitrate reductase molybdenum cofactor assembly chaperone [Pseudomonadales bacterium]
MDILKVVSHLMNYPTQDMIDNADELREVIASAREIPPASRQQITDLLNTLCDRDLMDVQEEFGNLFDRGRSLSLLLFEHVHGESRDRGQAMVNLMKVYSENGFHISVRELPDYIPLYLEYLGQRPDLEAREWLADVAPILANISARLTERKSLYHCLFDALLIISGANLDIADIQTTVAKEPVDHSLEALDKIWEEEAVTFGGDAVSGGCPTTNKPAGKQQVQPSVKWVDAAASSQAKQNTPRVL